MRDAIHRYEGSCHCGALGFTYLCTQPAEQWEVRECQCTFCRRHNSRNVSDPRGSVQIHIRDASKLERYRFGSKTTDFLLCKGCGVYIAAVLESPAGSFATININAIQPPVSVKSGRPMDYDAESAEDKRLRREQRWTPVVER